MGVGEGHKESWLQVKRQGWEKHSVQTTDKGKVSEQEEDGKGTRRLRSESWTIRPEQSLAFSSSGKEM